MVSELVLFQLSSFCALVGMTLGWRGVMTKYAGFYDLPTAWNQVFWGIVLGGVYAVMADGMLFRPYYTTVLSEDSVYTGLNIFSLMAVVLFASVFPISSYAENVSARAVHNQPVGGPLDLPSAVWSRWS